MRESIESIDLALFAITIFQILTACSINFAAFGPTPAFHTLKQSLRALISVTTCPTCILNANERKQQATAKASVRWLRGVVMSMRTGVGKDGAAVGSEGVSG